MLANAPVIEGRAEMPQVNVTLVAWPAPQAIERILRTYPSPLQVNGLDFRGHPGFPRAAYPPDEVIRVHNLAVSAQVNSQDLPPCQMARGSAALEGARQPLQLRLRGQGKTAMVAVCPDNVVHGPRKIVGDPIDRFTPKSPTIGLNLYQYGLLNPVRYNDPTGLSEEEGIFAKLGRKFDEFKAGVTEALVKPFEEAVKENQRKFSLRAGDDPETAEKTASEHASAAAERSRVEARKMVDSAADGAVVLLGTKGLAAGVKGGQKLLALKPKLTQEGLEHIVERHWATSGAGGAGKFASGTRIRDLQGMINDTATKGVGTLSRNNTTKFEYDFGRQIGTDIGGRPATRMRLIIDNQTGSVVTAFPIR